MLTFCLIILVLFAFGTYWGWTNIVTPYLWPVIKILWGTLRIAFWGGLIIYILHSSFFYRAFGWNFYTVELQLLQSIGVSSKFIQTQQTRLDYLYNEDGLYSPSSDNLNIKPKFPSWSPWAVLIGIAVFVSYRHNRCKEKTKKKASRPLKRPVHTDIKQLETPIIDTTTVDLSQLKSVLLGLGYTNKDFKSISSKIFSTDLDSQIRSALSLLRQNTGAPSCHTN
jgi:hypothetical protein